MPWRKTTAGAEGFAGDALLSIRHQLCRTRLHSPSQRTLMYAIGTVAFKLAQVHARAQSSSAYRPGRAAAEVARPAIDRADRRIGRSGQECGAAAQVPAQRRLRGDDLSGQSA